MGNLFELQDARGSFVNWLAKNVRTYVAMRTRLRLRLGFLALGLVMGLAGMAAPAYGQEAAPGAKQMPSPDEVVDRLGSKLNLSEDEKAQIKPIIVDRREKLAALQSDGSMRRRKKAREMKSIVEASDKKINALLNDDQKKQYAEIEQQMREQMKARMQNRNN